MRDGKNYVNLFIWIGSRNNQLIPSINKNGATNFKEVLTRWSFENIKESIVEISDRIVKFENVESLLLSNLWRTNENTSVVSVLSSEKEETVNLYHSSDLLVEKGDFLIFFRQKGFISDLVEEIVLLVPKNPQHLLYLCKYNSFLEVNSSFRVLVDIKEREVTSYLLFSCNNCNKRITVEESYLSDRENDLDFCSSECMINWKEEDEAENYNDRENIESEGELSEVIEDLRIDY